MPILMDWKEITMEKVLERGREIKLVRKGWVPKIILTELGSIGDQTYLFTIQSRVRIRAKLYNPLFSSFTVIITYLLAVPTYSMCAWLPPPSFTHQPFHQGT